MPFINSEESIFSKYPSDLQIKIKSLANKPLYVPFIGHSFDVTKEMIAEHYGGTGLPCNITEGNTDYKGTIETGWLTDGIPQDWIDQGISVIDAQRWEYFLFAYLINPANQGRSVPFDIEFHEREYTGQSSDANVEKVVGGEIWAGFRGCKINHHTMSVTQGSEAKRTYEWMGKRGRWGSGGEDTGGQ